MGVTLLNIVFAGVGNQTISLFKNTVARNASKESTTFINIINDSFFLFF